MKLALSLLPDSELAAVGAAGRLARRAGLSAERSDEMTHALVEACINAREHGGGRDGPVRVEIAERDGDIHIRVSDRGCGFDRARRPSGRRGHGLAIIHALMDEVRIHSGPEGTIVSMVKHGRSES